MSEQAAPIWANTTVKIGDLKPWDSNPKTSTKKDARALLKSWDELGQFQTVAIGPGGEVYDGHQRLSALLTVHGPEYEIVARQSDRPLTDEERRKIALYSRQIGQWDWDALSSWEPAQLMEWGGFDADTLKTWKRDVTALDNFLKSEQPEPEDAEPQIDRAEELREKWGVELGQMWQLGEHRLICGDCTDPAVVARVMGGERAQMCFTSPPYNAGKTATEAKTGAESKYKDDLDDKTSEKYTELLNGFTDCALSVCDYTFVNIQVLAKNKSAFIKYQSDYSAQLCDYAIWDKQTAQPAMAHRVMDSRFEFVLVFGGNGSRAIGTRDFRGMVHNVYTGNPQRKNENADIHAATFPIDFPAHFIKTFTNENEIIYEPFSGSGTTLIAGENTGRKVRAIEISPAYCAVTIQRYFDLTGKTPELIDKGAPD